MTASQICQFYRGQNVLVTGSTGFMGKILVEKLLRSTDVERIYLLVREKKGKNVHNRLDEMFGNVIFDKLKRLRPKFRDRITALPGDCSLPGLGLTLTDRQTLTATCNVVFHVAATVRFDENLKLAYAINVSGTADIIELCRQMTALRACVHVSTAFANCHLDTIEERLYTYDIGYDSVGAALEKLSRHQADELTSRLIGRWPNTYTFTKSLAEALVKDTAGGIPLGVFRPAIVISTYKEPIEGWIDNFYGPTGACAGATSGLLRIFRADKDVVADVVPVDSCVAGLIACGWDIHERSLLGQSAQPVYNYVSSVENPITWEEYKGLNTIYADKYPLCNSLWTVKFWIIGNPLYYFFLKFLIHFLPALLMDLGLMLSGRKPRLCSMYKKIHKFSDVIASFSTKEWKFRNDNVQRMWAKMNQEDRDTFPLSVAQVIWLSYFRNYIKGIRVYLLKDELDTLPGARVRDFRFKVANAVLVFVVYFVLGCVLWNVAGTTLWYLSGRWDRPSSDSIFDYLFRSNVVRNRTID